MNLGYACINMTLGGQKPKITTNRSMIKKTFIDRGIDYAGELSLLNSRDLCEIVKWNVVNGINFGEQPEWVNAAAAAWQPPLFGEG